MERRLLLWFVTSTAFLLIYMALNVMFVPPPPKPAKPDGDAAVGDLAQQTAEANDLLDKSSPVEPGKSGLETNGEADLSKVAPARITLGSMDPKSGFFILATLNNRGGGIERLELTERTKKGGLKYRRVDTTSGYLGYLAAETSAQSDGCVVRVVGPGTPAATAKAETQGIDNGLVVGDLITAVNAKAITGPEQFASILEKTKPGQSVTLEVRRAKSVDTANGDSESKPASLKFVATLTDHPLDLIRLASSGGADEVKGNIDRLACRLTLSQLGNKTIPTGSDSIEGLEWIADAIYQQDIVNADTNSATFTLPITKQQLGGMASGPLTITRSYSVAPGSYLIDMDVSVRNAGEEPQKVAYRLEGPNSLTLEGWWYVTKISPNWFGGAAARDVIYKTTREGHRLLSGYDLLKRAKNEPKEPDDVIFAADEDEAARSVQYIGIDAQYFNVAFVPPADTPSFRTFRQAAATIVADADAIPTHQERAVDVSFFVDSLAVDLDPGAAIKQPLRMFAGPKVPELIAPFGLDATIEYGWFGGVSVILGWVLHTLYAFVANYAIAIVLLTVLVRGLLFPVSRKAAIHAQRMQELAPELKKINDKFKDDMEGKLKAQREFQKKVGFNPLAGCLPAFLQLPIFMGLYRCLSVDIELRQAEFAKGTQWASNLAAPDMMSYWGDWLMEYFSGRGTGWLGPYFNILPILVVILFFIQQKLFMPPPTDEQQEMTQKVMSIMTFMMALFFFRVPAGLCVYFITSSLWGIVERIVVKKTIPKSKGLVFNNDVVEGTVTARATPEKESFADRIRKQLNPEPPKAIPVAKRKKPPGKK